MRNWTALLGGVAAVATVIAMTPEVRAQSFLQKIFGFGGGSNAAPYTMPRARQILPAHRFQNRPINRPLQSRSNGDEADDQTVGPPDSGGPYKTMCVRSCDGFYFPLRHNAQRKNFGSDVKSCHNACGSDAKLFYYSLRGPEGADAMIDLAGKKYSELPQAFAYRKALVDGCLCKPDPWAYQESARHQSYADQEAIELAKDEAFVKARAEAKSKTVATAEAAESPGAYGASHVVAAVAADLVSKPAIVEIDVTAEVQKSIRAEPQSAALRASLLATLAKPESAPRERPLRRRAKAYVQRTSIKTTSSPSYFWSGKKKYAWPGYSQ